LDVLGLTTTQDIVAFSRPSSINRPANLALKDKGVELREMDLAKDSQDQLVAALKRIDVLLSAIGAPAQLDQIPLVTAAKTAGVKRFVPCGYIPVIPAGGVHLLRDQKEEVYNHMKRLGLPYTIIDCGWWYQVSTPRLPSGKIDNVIMMEPPIANKGEQPSALTDLRDVGRYVARVIKDDRTLNKQVLVYNEMWSQSQVWDKLEEVSGEKLTRNYVSQEQLEGKLADAKKVLESDPSSFMNLLHMIEYANSALLWKLLDYSADMAVLPS